MQKALVVDGYTSCHCESSQSLIILSCTDSGQAPGEAEAQCAELARAGKVYAAGSEDMDTLTFHTPVLLRHLTFSEAKKMPISEINLDVALEDLDMTMDRVSRFDISFHGEGIAIDVLPVHRVMYPAGLRLPRTM
jgi:5'-3' exonuclease